MQFGDLCCMCNVYAIHCTIYTDTHIFTLLLSNFDFRHCQAAIQSRKQKSDGIWLHVSVPDCLHTNVIASKQKIRFFFFRIRVKNIQKLHQHKFFGSNKKYWIVSIWKNYIFERKLFVSDFVSVWKTIFNSFLSKFLFLLSLSKIAYIIRYARAICMALCVIYDNVRVPQRIKFDKMNISGKQFFAICIQYIVVRIIFV